MKNQILLGTILISILIPITTLATSGACSWHGGVNCGIFDVDGSVICNDGWRDSSVNYSETDECRVNPRIYCPPPVAYGCATEEDIGKTRAMCAANGILGSSMCGVAACQQEVENYKKSLVAYQQCLNAFSSTYSNPPTSSPKVPAITDKNFTCQLEHGANAYFNETNARCECVDDYTPNSSTPFQCISWYEFCRDLFGSGALTVKVNGRNTCKCFSDYEFNANGTACVPKTPTLSPSSIVIPIPTNFFSQLFTPTPTITSKTPITPTPKRVKSPPLPISSISPSPSPESSPSSTPTPSKIEKTAGHKFGTNLFVTISRIFKKLKFW